jgi:hypothetical protein
VAVWSDTVAVTVILEGRLAETVQDGEVMAATLDEGATVGNGVHVRITSVDKHRRHPALRHLTGQRVRVTVEAISDDTGTADDDDTDAPAAAAPAAVGRPAPATRADGEAQRWADLVDKVAQRRRLEASTA